MLSLLVSFVIAQSCKFDFNCGSRTKACMASRCVTKPYPTCLFDSVCMTGEKCTLNNCSNAPGIAMRQIDSVFESSGFFEANITVTFTNGQVEMVQYSPRGIYPGLAGQTKPGNTNGPTSTSNAPETKTTKASSSKRDSLGLFALTAILLF